MEMPSWTDAVTETRKARAAYDRAVARVDVVRAEVEAEVKADTRVADAETAVREAAIPLEAWRSLTRGISKTPFEEVVAPKHPRVADSQHARLVSTGYTHRGEGWYVKGAEEIDATQLPGGNPIER